MSIKSIRLQNFKGFKDARIDLKPLTVILGPNSAGKSSFGQALVALSKSNARDNILNISFDQHSSVEFGGYSDLVHSGCEGSPVFIELGINSGTLKLGFGGEITKNPKANIKELDLTYIEYLDNSEIKTTSEKKFSGEVSHIFPTAISEKMSGFLLKPKIWSRDNDRVWSVIKEGLIKEDSVEKYKLFFEGLNIEGVSHLTGTAVAPREVLPIVTFQDLSSLLEKISYLRPDRLAPIRENRVTPPTSGPEIDDFGGGTDWFAHKYKNHKFKTFWFPNTASDSRINESTLIDLANQKVKLEPLKIALSKWLTRLGLAESLQTKVIDRGRAIQTLATPAGQIKPRSLSDVGFGVSQVLPILIQGLTLEDNGLLVVEQPEAQLHPKPQEGLADFFCSMVKCNKNVLVETHSEGLFHQLRLRAAMDGELAEKIAVYFIDEPENGNCCNPIPISLLEGCELKWPKGFWPDGMRAELAIRDARKAMRAMGV